MGCIFLFQAVICFRGLGFYLGIDVREGLAQREYTDNQGWWTHCEETVVKKRFTRRFVVYNEWQMQGES